MKTVTEREQQSLRQTGRRCWTSAEATGICVRISPGGRTAQGSNMGFLSFVALLAIAYLVWRVADMLPDLVYRVSEIQRDIGEIRRQLRDEAQAGEASAPASDDGDGDDEQSGS